MTPLSLAAPTAAGAWQLLQLHRPELALRMAEQLLAADPAALSALLARTEALRQLGRLPEAVAAARDALGAAPQSASAHAALARALGQQGYLIGAEQAIAEALRLNPTEAGYFAFLAHVQYLLHGLDDAIASANQGLRLNARHTDCLLWRAMAQEKIGRLAAADADFTQLLRLAPTSYLVHQRYGQLLLARGEAPAAANHLTEALRLWPGASAEVVPLLRQARRWQHWPAWFRQQHRHLRHEWHQQQQLGWRATGTALLLPFFGLAARWHTRRDPLYRRGALPTTQPPKQLPAIALVLFLLVMLGGGIGAAAYYSNSNSLLLNSLGPGLAGGLAALGASLKARKSASASKSLH